MVSLPDPPTSSASKSRSKAWSSRHTQLLELSALPIVLEAHHEALHAATLLSQTDENAAATCASHVSSSRLIDSNKEGEQLGRRLDISSAILLSAPEEARETNTMRSLARSSLLAMLKASLHESSDDFDSLNCLESSTEGTVELVRCRFDRQIYVMKSTTKGAAKRGYRSNSPMTERRLLSAVLNAEKGKTRFTPACVAAFQSQASLHILMEYCPVGDLYHFLESAGQAALPNEARNPSGGLLCESYVRGYAIDIVAAVSWLHRQGYMHRDIKPGNFLFDRSGHLLLCDMASAAPFALFPEVPPSASLPNTTTGAAGSMRTMKVNQRRILYRHCCMIGTPDYIAPEILWTADLISRRKRRLYESSYCSAETTILEDKSWEEEGKDDDEPPPEGPGLYGPECDWWSVGVLLFEMAYKQLPFFSETVAYTMDMIKHHHKHFAIDHRIDCSDDLKDLLCKLITDTDTRIGSVSSFEVQHHPFFRGVNWSKPWASASPFVPRVETANTAGCDTLGQPELSVLHSPRVGSDNQSCSYDGGPKNWSKMWTGKEADDFPVFPNSVEYSRAAQGLSVVVGQAPDESQHSFASTMQSTSIADMSRSSKRESRRSAMKQWSKFDPTWIGFSYVPEGDALVADDAASTSNPSSSPIAYADAEEKVLVMSDPSDFEYSSTKAEQGAPMTSTPHRVAIPQPADIPRTVMKPRASLHRHALQTASRVRIASGAADPSQLPINDGRFVTPVRKPSYNNLAMNGQSPYASGDGAHVPASPYPFPIAVSARRPKKTPGPRIGLRRNDLDRARSASAEVGEGSESRFSGGSNSKRNISEREAWHELEKAVMETARKSSRKAEGVRDFSRNGKEEAYDENAENRLNGGHMADETHVPAQARRRAANQDGGSAFKVVSFQPRPSLSRLLSEEGFPRRQPLQPILDTTPPHTHTDDLTSTLSASASSLELSSDEDEQSPQKHTHGDNPAAGMTAAQKQTLLARRKSARQLLLKAQYRDTPTRIARTASPMLSTFSLADDAAADVHGAATRRRSASVDEMQSGGGGGGGGARGMPTVRLKRLDSLPAVPTMLPGAVRNLKRLDSRLMKRRDSHETLMQYRQGIIPDDEVDEEDGKTAALQKERRTTAPAAVLVAPVAVRPAAATLVAMARPGLALAEPVKTATTAVTRTAAVSKSPAKAATAAVAADEAADVEEYVVRYDRLQEHISLLDDRLQQLRARLQ